MIRLTRAEIIGDVVFLTDAEAPDRLLRLPAAPAPVVVAGTPELRLMKFRETIGDADPDLPSGAVLSVTIDTAPASLQIDRAEVTARARRDRDTPPATSVVVAGGEVSLFLGDHRLATSPVPAGARGLTTLSAVLSVEGAVLVDANPDGGASPLAITARYDVFVLHEGPSMRVTVNADAAARWMGGASIPSAEIDAKIDAAIAAGFVRIELTGEGDARAPTARAVIAGALFTPVPSGTWSGIPTLRGVGAVRARGGATVTWTLAADAPTLVPVFASAALPAVPEAKRAEVEVPTSQVEQIKVVPLALQSTPDVALIEVDLEFPDGGARTLTFRRANGDGPRSVPFVATTRPTQYRWRTRAFRADGLSTSTDWRTSQNRVLVIVNEAPHGDAGSGATPS